MKLDFSSENLQEAHMMALAKVLNTLQQDGENNVKETFILRSEGIFLDAHGVERNILRLGTEIDTNYAPRVQSLTNQSNCPSLNSLIDQLLLVGTATILEDSEAGVFFDREDFLDRGEVIIDAIYNVFSIIVDQQLHDPFSFFDREFFCDREDFMGTNETSQEVFDLILEAVNGAKALGTLYRIIELR